MFEQANTQVLNASKQFADAAFKAQGIAMEGFEKAFDLQLKAFQNSFNATAAFLSENSDLKNPESLQTLLPKSAALLRESAEQSYATTQQLVDVSVKTGEALSGLVKAQFEAANETFVKPVTAARKAK